MEEKEKQNVYDIVTLKIIEQMEKGTVPWKQPWFDAGLPQNLVSGKPYRGINVWLLAMLGYQHNLFLTYKQANKLGGMVKKGETSHPVVFWNWKEVEDKNTGEKVKKPFLRYYLVFNIAQCEGIPKDKIPGIAKQNDPIQVCEDIVRFMPDKPEIRHEVTRAYYSPLHDYINMPAMEKFYDSESYYATLFHELVHSTGHTSRLNRKELMENGGFEAENYSIEELTAEIGACYLQNTAGIMSDDYENAAAYIYHWIEQLRNDHRFIVFACSAAQKAVDYILNVREDKEENEPVLTEYEYVPPF